jgi:hypothetical protein
MDRPAMENSVCHHNGNFVGLVLCGVKAFSWTVDTEANIGNGSRDGFPVGGGVVKAVSSVVLQISVFPAWQKSLNFRCACSKPRYVSYALIV